MKSISQKAYIIYLTQNQAKFSATHRHELWCDSNFQVNYRQIAMNSMNEWSKYGKRELLLSGVNDLNQCKVLRRWLKPY